MSQKQMAVRPHRAAAPATKTSSQKAQVVTYQDYTLKLEKTKPKKTTQLPKEHTQTTLNSTPFSVRPKTASATQVIAQKPAIQNFIIENMLANIDQDDSLLQDSQASKTRTEKQQILAEQIAQRRLKANEDARQKEEAAQRRIQNLNQLNQRFKAQVKSVAKIEKIRKSKERSQERSLKRKTAELVKKHAHLATAKTEGASKQLSDLRNWIDEQLTQEKLDQPEADSESQASEVTKGKENNTHNQIKLGKVDVTDGNQLLALKHKLPGNSMLSEKEDSKLGARANRYGVFNDTASEFDKVVQIQSQKGVKPVQKQPIFTEADSKIVKKHAGQVLKDIAKKVGGYDQTELNQASDDSAVDQVPVKQPIVAVSSQKQVRKVINQPAPIEERMEASELPGVTNARSTQAKLDKTRRGREIQAVIVIQKFLRGYWGRQDAKKQKAKRFKEIGAQYDRYQKEFKKNQEYDLQRYLQDKKKVRAKNGFESIEEITEEIGESIGSSNKFVSTALSAQFTSMFAKTAASSSEFDPLSLISIYAKRHAAPPPAQKPQVKQKIPTQVKQQDVIEESIQYSQSFERASGSIPEDIPKASGSSDPSIKGQIKVAKAIVQSDSIIDEIPSVRKSDAKSDQDSIADDIPFAKNDSDTESIIEEESFLQEDYKKNNLKAIDAQKNLEARNRERFGVPIASQDKAGKKTVQVAEVKHDSEVRYNNAIGGLLQEMKAYETSNLSQVMMDRMEKIVVSSLAQKDQIIMAQRLGELERENRHKEEINKIREEQIRLMSQLMLLGTATQQHTNFSKQQRDEMLSSIQKIIEKPIEIKHETHVNYNIGDSMASHQIRQPAQSVEYKAEIFKPAVKRQTYLEEYDEGKKKFSNSKPLQESDDIVDEVGSVIGESIPESIEGSGSGKLSSYEDFKANQFKLASQNSVALSNLLNQLDRAIQKEKQQQESNLQQSLRRNQISPRTFDRRRVELERWAASERKEAKEQHKTITEQNNYKKKIAEESMDSDVKLALNQAHLLDRGLIGMSPDAKYIQRKKEAAQKLLNEKERVIQEQLNQKLRGLESELANDELKQALELDIDKEVTKRYEAAKKQIEESQGWESSRSALSVQKDAKAKKNVQFQQNVKPVPSLKIDKVSSSGEGIEEEIVESIGSQYSQSFNSASKSKSLVSEKPKQLIYKNPSQSEIDEKISEKYSEDNFNSSAGESDSKLGSRQKLQNKIKDIAESAQYSDDFDENSISQSQGLPATGPTMIETKNKKMESVVEESDSSQQRPSHSGSNLEKESSLPSEDVEVQDSVRSVDWQINCPQDTNRTGEEYSDSPQQESIKEEESSLNDRLSDELESNPDQISGSLPEDNNFALADRIAQELMNLLIQDYKEDEIYVVSKDRVVVDEEAFKGKFPYTLDKVEPERPIMIKQQQPDSPKSARAPPKATPSAKELADKKFLLQHEQEQDQLKKQQEKLTNFLDFLCKRVDINLLVDQLDRPVQQDPLVILAQIQAYEDEEPPQQPDLEMQQILQQSFFNKIDREYCTVLRLQSNVITEDISVSQEDRENIQNVHNYAVFEALNEALDSERPYKSKGEPMPWSKNTRAVKQATTPEMAKKVLERARAKVVEWSLFGAGSKYAPLPPPPTQTQDEFGDEIQQPPLNEGEEERRNQQRQEKLGQLMTNDIKDTDCHWIDYEIEETQVRFDLADMILADLAAEICQFLK